MTSFQQPQDFNKIIDQSNQGNLMRFNKLTTAITENGVYTQTELEKLQQQIDFHEKRIDILESARNNMLSRIEELEEVLDSQLEEKKKPPKKSWLSRLIRN